MDQARIPTSQLTPLYFQTSDLNLTLKSWVFLSVKAKHSYYQLQSELWVLNENRFPKAQQGASKEGSLQPIMEHKLPNS